MVIGQSLWAQAYPTVLSVCDITAPLQLQFPLVALFKCYAFIFTFYDSRSGGSEIHARDRSRGSVYVGDSAGEEKCAGYRVVQPAKDFIGTSPPSLIAR